MSSSQSAPDQSSGFNFAQIAVDLVLCGLFFALMFHFVRSHVMSNNSTAMVIFGAYTATCVTGVFWMALQMLRVVAKGEKQIKASRAGK